MFLSSGGPLKPDLEYLFKQFHFHWGSSDDTGSEHKVNGNFYPLEMHLVHFNSKYDNLVEALKHKDGILVIGVLFKVDDVGNEELQKTLVVAKDLDIPNVKGPGAAIFFDFEQFTSV